MNKTPLLPPLPEEQVAQPPKSYAESFGIYGCCASIPAASLFPLNVEYVILIGFVFITGGWALGTAVGLFFDSLTEKLTTDTKQPNKTGVAVMALILGIVGLVAWIIPLVGFPVTIIGFMLGRKARLSSRRSFALTGMGLSLLGLLLSVGNFYLGLLNYCYR